MTGRLHAVAAVAALAAAAATVVVVFIVGAEGTSARLARVAPGNLRATLSDTTTLVAGGLVRWTTPTP